MITTQRELTDYLITFYRQVPIISNLNSTELEQLVDILTEAFSDTIATAKQVRSQVTDLESELEHTLHLLSESEDKVQSQESRIIAALHGLSGS